MHCPVHMHANPPQMLSARPHCHGGCMQACVLHAGSKVVEAQRLRQLWGPHLPAATEVLLLQEEGKPLGVISSCWSASQKRKTF